MLMELNRPLFAFEKDDSSMFLIERPDRLLYHLEAIDIENDEYLFWDSSGAAVSVSTVHGKIDRITPCDQSMSLADAFRMYSHSRGLEISAEGTPVEVWECIQSRLPRKKGFWKRLFPRLQK